MSCIYGKRGLQLLKEVAFCTPENMPPYNDEGVRLVLEEVREHFLEMHRMYSKVKEDTNAEDINQMVWDNHLDHAATVVVQRAALLRNKRLLMAYVKERADRIKALRWQSRNIPEQVRGQLSPLELDLFQSYDKLLTSYMRRGPKGVGIDLTLDELPPKEPSVQVKVLRDYGEVVFSIGAVDLRRNTMHFLPRPEAEPLVREGVFEYADNDHYD